MRDNRQPAATNRLSYVTVILLFLLFPAMAILNKSGRFSARSGTLAFIKDCAKYHVNYQLYLKSSDPAEPVRGDLLLPLPATIEPYQVVENLCVSPLPSRTFLDGYGNETSVFPVSCSGSKEMPVTLSFDVTVFHVRFPLRVSEKVEAAENGKYLIPEGAFKSDLAQVREIADNLCCDEPVPLYRLVKIYDFVRTGFVFKENPAPRSIEEVLHDKVAQCCDANVLFISLCRASGIPAQFSGGIYVSIDRVAFPQTHSWARVYIEGIGWIPVDPTLGRFDSYSRNICLGEQRKFYIEMWKGSPDGAAFSPSRDDMKMPEIYLRMDLNPYFTGKKLPDSDAMISPQATARPGGIQEDYSGDSFGSYFQGLAYERSGAIEKASGNYEKAVKGSPRFVRAHKALITCSFRIGKGDEIASRYRAMLDSSPEDTLLKYYYGICLLCQEKYSRAEQLLKECEEEGFVSSELYNSLGFLYLRTKQMARAEETFALALCATGDHFAVYENLMSMLQDAEEWEKTLYWAGKGLEEFPDNQIFLGQMGYGFLRLKRPEMALKYIDLAIQKDPGLGWYHALKGWALKESGDDRKAREEITKGLRMKSGIGNEKFYEDMLLELN